MTDRVATATVSGPTVADEPAIKKLEQRRKPLGRRILAGLAKHCVLIGLSIIFLIPLVWMGTGAFKTVVDLNASPIVWFPDQITFDNFTQAAQLFPLARYFLNTS